MVDSASQPLCWSPVGDASPSLPPSGSALAVEVVKAARNEHPEGLALIILTDRATGKLYY